MLNTHHRPYLRTSQPRRALRDQGGQVVVFFALLVPVMLALTSVVIAGGNWFAHAKHLQTKADAGALAGGSAWRFPCGSDIDTRIETAARQYVGPHTQADGAQFPLTGNPAYNDQLGGVTADDIQVRLNASDWFDDDSNSGQVDMDSPNSTSFCPTMILDVKATESNSFPLASIIPLFPDLKRKARVRIEETEGVRGLLPIAVRVPKPESAAAIFINEDTTTPGAFGTILSAQHLCESNSISNLPVGLGGWTSFDPTNTEGPSGTSLCPNWASFSMPAKAGVVVALSFRPRCPDPDGDPCFSVNGYTNVNTLCNQTTPSGVAFVQCFYTTGSGSTQSVQTGLQYLYGYQSASPDPAPDVESVWLSGAAGVNCGPNPTQAGSAYFAAPVTNSCTATLNANVNRGAAPPGDNLQVRYKQLSGNTSSQTEDPPGSCGNNYQPGCELTSGQATVTLDPAHPRHAFVLQVQIRNVPNPAALGLPGQCGGSNYSNQCSWYFTALGRTPTNEPPTATMFDNPLQRAFLGDIDLSGSVKWIRVVADQNAPCDTPTVFGSETGQAASVPSGGTRCFYVDLGLQGAVPRDQDEYPLAFNLSTTSQHQLLDCDPNIPQGQIDDAIASGCGPWYKAHDFLQTPLCPPQNSIFDLPQPPPWQEWDPKTCVKTRPTASGNQLQQGFNFRIFGDKTNPSCPTDIAPGAAGFQWGRNYWNDANNANDTVTDPVTGEIYDTTFTEQGPLGAHDYGIPAGDPRLVTLFFTPYDSFGGNGQATFPIVGLGQFYITGWGRAGSIDDPCSDGSSSGIPGAGNLPPPDLNFGNNYFVWGHFIKGVILGGPALPSGEICDPASTQPCVPVLVE